MSFCDRLAAWLAAALLAAGLGTASGLAQAQQPSAAAPVGTMTIGAETGAEIAPPVTLTVGKSTLVRLPGPIERISLGNPSVLDVTLTGARELYLLGKSFGTSNVMLWRRGGAVTVLDVTVVIDTTALQQQLAVILPEEKEILVRSAADSIVLAGSVSSAIKADHAVALAEGYARAYTRPATAVGQGLGAGGGGAGGAGAANPLAALMGGGGGGQQPKVINLMAVAAPQQVMLEVKVAEVSRTLLDQFGISFNGALRSGGTAVGIITSQLVDTFGSLFAQRTATGGRVLAGGVATLDGKNEDGAVKILAEPTIVAISGQEASFLAGGKIFIPVARSNNTTGTVTITLEEKEFGVGLRFTPLVLDGDLISLRVAPEVSELSRTGTPFVTTTGVTTVLPSFTTRRAQTTVQLRDGNTLAIAGLIKNNVTENVKRFPILGEIPILGALFRSTEFLSDQSELLFLVTPRLVKSLPPVPTALPTDNYTPSGRVNRILNGRLEGLSPPPAEPAAAPPATAAPAAAPAVAAPAAAPASAPGDGMRLK